MLVTGSIVSISIDANIRVKVEIAYERDGNEVLRFAVPSGPAADTSPWGSEHDGKQRRVVELTGSTCNEICAQIRQCCRDVASAMRDSLSLREKLLEEKRKMDGYVHVETV